MEGRQGDILTRIQYINEATAMKSVVKGLNSSPGFVGVDCEGRLLGSQPDISLIQLASQGESGAERSS